MREVTRRELIAGSAAAAAGVCACCGGGCATFTGVGKTPSIDAGAYTVKDGKLEIDLGKATQLATVGGSVKIIDPALSDSLIVVRTGDEQYVVASLICTHRGKVELNYQHDQKRFKCASLGSSKFGLDGKNLGGPADKPLRIYKVSKTDGALVVALSA